MKFYEKENSFRLSIVGYQFPNKKVEPYDSNWLIIHINISSLQGAWVVTDPCLLTYEVSLLADWFDNIDSGNFEKMECNFIEPVISFRVVKTEPHKFLRICFRLEALPPWANDQDEYFIEFALPELELKSASEDLRKQLKKYPQRAEK